MPLLPPAQAILEKYNWSPEKGDAPCLPLPSNQKMNEYLKEVATLCGITKNLTVHVARHTFATTVTLGNKVSLQNVSKMLGHSSTRMTQHYARVLDQNIMDDMEKVRNSFGYDRYWFLPYAYRIKRVSVLPNLRIVWGCNFVTSFLFYDFYKKDAWKNSLALWNGKTVCFSCCLTFFCNLFSG